MLFPAPWVIFLGLLRCRYPRPDHGSQTGIDPGSLIPSRYQRTTCTSPTGIECAAHQQCGPAASRRCCWHPASSTPHDVNGGFEGGCRRRSHPLSQPTRPRHRPASGSRHGRSMECLVPRPVRLRSAKSSREAGRRKSSRAVARRDGAQRRRYGTRRDQLSSPRRGVVVEPKPDTAPRTPGQALRPFPSQERDRLQRRPRPLPGAGRERCR